MRIKVLILYMGGARPGGTDRKQTLEVKQGFNGM